jgi:hypothetical protein
MSSAWWGAIAADPGAEKRRRRRINALERVVFSLAGKALSI